MCCNFWFFMWWKNAKHAVFCTCALRSLFLTLTADMIIHLSSKKQLERKDVEMKFFQCVIFWVKNLAARSWFKFTTTRQILNIKSLQKSDFKENTEIIRPILCHFTPKTFVGFFVLSWKSQFWWTLLKKLSFRWSYSQLFRFWIKKLNKGSVFKLKVLQCFHVWIIQYTMPRVLTTFFMRQTINWNS